MALPRIGFVGLGVMGAPMAGHLLAAGHPLTVHDLSADAARTFADAHPAAEVVGTPAQLAARSDVVITMLPNGREVERAALGAEGLVDAFSPGALLLDTSSSEPWLTRQTAQALAVRGVAMVDAPVSGAQAGAQSAQLVFMIGGEPAAVARATPILRRMGRALFHLGPLGAGHTMKCINNLMTAMNFLAAAEGLVIGKRCGLDPAAMTAVLNESTGMSWVTQNHVAQRILSRRFDDPFKLELMVKDIDIALTLAREAGLPLPLSALGEELWNAVLGAIGPGGNVSDAFRWVEQRTQTEIAPTDRSTD